VLQEVPEFGSGKGGAQVGVDPVRHSEPVCDFFNELGCLCRRCSCDRLHPDPLGEFVDGDKYMSEAALCRLERSNRIESLAGEWPGWRDCPQGLRRVLAFLMPQNNINSASAQNHRCRTSPWSIPGYRIFSLGKHYGKEYRKSNDNYTSLIIRLTRRGQARYKDKINGQSMTK
jgi:hypothetical protein